MHGCAGCAKVQYLFGMAESSSRGNTMRLVHTQPSVQVDFARLNPLCAVLISTRCIFLICFGACNIDFVHVLETTPICTTAVIALCMSNLHAHAGGLGARMHLVAASLLCRLTQSLDTAKARVTKSHAASPDYAADSMPSPRVVARHCMVSQLMLWRKRSPEGIRDAVELLVLTVPMPRCSTGLCALSCGLSSMPLQ